MGALGYAVSTLPPDTLAVNHEPQGKLPEAQMSFLVAMSQAYVTHRCWERPHCPRLRGSCACGTFLSPALCAVSVADLNLHP